MACAGRGVNPYGMYTGPYQQANHSNPLHGEAMTARAMALKIYHPIVAHVITETLAFMAVHSWSGDQNKLRALIDGVRADAAKFSTDFAA